MASETTLFTDNEAIASGVFHLFSTDNTTLNILSPAVPLLEAGGGYDDTFWFQTTFLTGPPRDFNARWSQVYPYQLMMIDASNNAVLVKFTLPITPQELNIRMPFAIQTTVTLKGIVEEHGGAPLREITFSGTTGTQPLRAVAEAIQSPSSVGSLFGGTIGAVAATAASFKSLVSPSSGTAGGDGGGLLSTNKLLTSISSGYFQFHMLYNFLEKYALIKKGKVDPSLKQNLSINTRDIRLVFAMWKDEWAWVITPREFTLRRSAQDPLSYNYNFSATAWKRINLGSAPAPTNIYTPVAYQPSGFAKLLGNLLLAIEVVQNAIGIIRGVKADFNTVFGALREVALYEKAIAGAIVALIDLPGDIVKAFKSTVIDSFASVGGAFGEIGSRFKDKKDKDTIALISKAVKLGSTVSASSPAALGSTTSSSAPFKVLSQGNKPADQLDTIFSNPLDNPTFFRTLDLPSLTNIPVSLSKQIDAEITRVSQFDRKDLEEKRAIIAAFATDLADRLNVGSETYTKYFGDNIPIAPLKTNELTPQEMDVLFALQDVIQELDRLVASRTIDDNKTVDSLEFVRALSEEAGIPFNVSGSKFLAPVLFGYTIEEIAKIYLNDPNRWSEIATLNNLRAPYIDETGFTNEFLTNGTGSQFTIDNKDNLFIGQTVTLYSNVVPRFKRQILNIEELGPSSVLITVSSGEEAISSLNTSERATMLAYLPGTVHSENLIYIPSSVKAPIDNKTKAVPGIDDVNNLVKLSGIDLLLTSSGDLAVTSDGEVRLAYGLSNIVQAAKIKLSVARGTLLQHPKFGFGVPVGTSHADTSAVQVTTAIRDTFTGDDRFTNIRSIKVDKTGPALKISLFAEVNGSSALIPISVEVPHK